MWLAVLNLIDKSNIPTTSADQSTVQVILNMAFVIIGALALLMLVISGARYIVFGSDPNKLTEIKRHILYSVAGLVIVASAALIVNFVISRITV